MGLPCPGAGAAPGAGLLWEHSCCPPLRAGSWGHACRRPALVLAAAVLVGEPSPAKAGSPQGGKGETWPRLRRLRPPACGSNLQAGGAAGRFRSPPPAGSQGPADTAVPGGGSSLAQDAVQGGGLPPNSSIPTTLWGFSGCP